MSIHESVLLKEAVEYLNLKEDSIVVDATLGSAGHSREILKIIKKGKLVAIDLDKKNIENFPDKNDERVVLINDNFANLETILADLKIEKVNAILADLGWSSDQLEGRGMSFTHDEPLDMRLDSLKELTARKVVNEYSQEGLERVIRNYGEEKYAENISKKIILARKRKSIETTRDLAEIIESAVSERYKHGKKNPATKTFQAIRIEVNQELKNLEEFIPQAIKHLEEKGRLAVISFHSLEDRIVKQILRQNAGGCICPKNFPKCVCGKMPMVSIITKKPVVPSEDEIERNPRARSAKLRVCEKAWSLRTTLLAGVGRVGR